MLVALIRKKRGFAPRFFYSDHPEERAVALLFHHAGHIDFL
jgi:hypothetical protein